MYFFKKKLQFIFKSFFRSIFKILYGKIYFCDKIKNIEVNTINSANIINFYNNKYKIYKIIKGRIYSDNVSNVAIISGNQIIKGASYQQINGELREASENVTIKIGTPRIKKYYKGRVLCLAQGASGHTNYCHWLLDILPKIKLYSEIYKLSDLKYFYLNKLNNFQKESLKLLDLDHIDIIDSNIKRHIQCDEITATDHPNYYKGFIMQEHKNIPTWIIEWLRNCFLKKSKKTYSSEKIFIDRSQSTFKHCQIINYKETIKFLEKNGFKSYKLENLSFKEQISLFQNSKTILSAHGAGLANLTFCSKNANVIEIRPENHPNEVYKTISKINNLNYNLYSTPKLKDPNKNGDIKIDFDILDSFIN